MNLLETIYQNEATIRFSFFFGSFFLLTLWESLSPKRVLTQDKTKRWINNIALIVCSTLLVRILIPTAAIGMAYIVEQHHIGVINHLEIPFWLTVVISFILLDLSIYIQHVIFHVTPVLWRFHRVHHSDLDFDVTTGIRFHPLEILISIFLKIMIIAMLGAPVLAVILFEITLNLMSMFTHSNIKLNKTIEQILRWLIVTPDMHRIHHSTRENETNSNFCFYISLWDRLFGTYIPEPAYGHKNMQIGLDQFRDHEWQNFKGLIFMPFSQKIRGYAINYRDTKNEDELAHAKNIAKKNHELEQLANELASYIEAIGQHALVSISDTSGNILKANELFCKVSGYTEDELLGKNHSIINSRIHSRKFFTKMWKTISSGNTWHGEICNRAKNGELYWVASTIVPIINKNGKIERYISVRLDITDTIQYEADIERAYTDLANANQQLEKQSRIDALTEISNRRYFNECLNTEISRMSRNNDYLTIILCDIDYFKNYNDFYGHLAGDDCLKIVAQTIKSCFSRKGEIVARYGGEEFAIILTSKNKQAALALAEEMRKRIEDLAIQHKASISHKVVTISAGISTIIPNKFTTITTIIAKADKALYLAKKKGRNNIQFID